MSRGRVTLVQLWILDCTLAGIVGAGLNEHGGEIRDEVRIRAYRTFLLLACGSASRSAPPLDVAFGVEGEVVSVNGPVVDCDVVLDIGDPAYARHITTTNYDGLFRFVMLLGATDATYRVTVTKNGYKPVIVRGFWVATDTGDPSANWPAHTVHRISLEKSE